MPTRVIDIRQDATAGDNSIEYSFHKGTLKAVAVSTNGNCMGLAYLRSTKGRPEDCPLIVGSQLANLIDAIWTGAMEVHKPLVMVAAFYGCAAGDGIELKLIIEV